MLKKILKTVAFAALLFILFVLMQPNEFRVSRIDTISAPISTVFTLVNDLHQWGTWSPWAKLDPNAKNSFDGSAAGTGAVMKWESTNSNVGEGMMTITESRPDELIKFKLEFKKPFAGTSDAEFTFKSEENKTLVTWSMYGKKNFISKAMGLIFNCEKMVGDQFEQGLTNIKSVVEAASK